MRKMFILMSLLIILLTGCTETPDELKQQISELKNEKSSLQIEVGSKQQRANDLDNNIISKQEKLNLIEHKINGDIPKYILTLELKQSHFTLDLGQHMKDSMNKITFDISVDEEFYNNQQVNSELLRQFRNGSLLLSGSFGDWVITVVSKRIEYIKSK